MHGGKGCHHRRWIWRFGLRPGARDTEFGVTVIDRRNHSLFQPLLYQVATAALSPADIAEPIRKTLGRYRNINMIMGEVVGIDTERKRVLLDSGSPIEFDQLVVATGSDYNYFGHDAWRAYAPENPP